MALESGHGTGWRRLTDSDNVVLVLVLVIFSGCITRLSRLDAPPSKGRSPLQNEATGVVAKSMMEQ
jgi:hypothetical protein